MANPDRPKLIPMEEILQQRQQIADAFQWAFGEREFLGEYLNRLPPQITATGFQSVEVDLTSFIQDEKERRFFTIILKAFPLLWQVYDGQTRWVNGRLYLAHVLKTAFFVHQLITDNNFDDSTYKRFILTALFHDAFEMNEYFRDNPEEFVSELKQSFPGYNDEWYGKVKDDVDFLTPKEKDPSQSYFQQKQADFERFFDGESCLDKEIRLVVKTADVWANLSETVEDLQERREDGQMMHTPIERYGVFSGRVARLRRALEDENFIRFCKSHKIKPALNQAVNQMESLLADYLDCLPSLKRFVEALAGFFGEESLEVEVKYVISGDEEIILFPSVCVHSSRSFDGQGVGGVLKVVRVEKGIFFYFVREATSIEGDKDGTRLWEILKGNPQIIVERVNASFY